MGIKWRSNGFFGNPTVGRTVLDRAARRVVQSSDGPASTLDALTVSVNGLVLTNVTATGVTTLHAYDPLARRVSSSSASAGGTRAVASVSGYDSLGRVAWTADAANTTNRFAYDPHTGRRVAVTNALGQATHTAYDADGRVLGTWGATYPVFYEYDPYGRMSAMYTLRDSSLQIAAHADFLANKAAFDKTTWLYHEPTGLLTNKLYADGKGTAYSYSPDGKLATRTWARGITTSYEYAPCCGNLTAITYSDGTPGVTNQYDRLGRQVAVIDGTGEHAYVYDPATLALAEELFPDGTVLTRAQDAFGRPAGIALGSGYAAAYGYDAYGRFSQVSNTQFQATYSYLPGSHLLAGYTLTDPVSNFQFQVSRSYEPHRDLIAAVSNTFGGTLISAFDYDNDALGRRTARADSGTAFASTQANAFGYNARSEVASADMRNGTSSYTFDPIGNRTEATLPDEPAPLAYTSNPLNQYTNIVVEGEAPSEPRHDEDGNMLLGPAGPDRATLAMVWDAENRLIAVTNGNTVVLNDYDYRSRRIRKRVLESGTLASDHRYLYDGWNLVRELSTVDGSLFTTNSFVWGLDLSGSLQGAGGIGGLLSVHTFAPFAFHFPTTDANGNVSEYLTTNGTLAAHYEYDAFGRTFAQSGDLAATFTHRFSTKYLDSETGLYYYGYRYYSPELGRWANRDPITERGGANVYGFCANAPVTHIDSDGRIAVAFPPIVHPPDNSSSPVPEPVEAALESTETAPGPEVQPSYTEGENGRRADGGALYRFRCCKSKKDRLLPIPGVTEPLKPPLGAGVGPTAGSHRRFDPFPTAPPVPAGGMGAGPCHLLIVKCKDNVTVFHFSVLDSPSKSLKLFTWPSGCTAIVCGGEEVKQSNCLGDDVLSSAAEAGIAVVGVSEKSGCGVSDNGDWWHLSL